MSDLLLQVRFGDLYKVIEDLQKLNRLGHVEDAPRIEGHAMLPKQGQGMMYLEIQIYPSGIEPIKAWLSKDSPRDYPVNAKIRYVPIRLCKEL